MTLSGSLRSLVPLAVVLLFAACGGSTSPATNVPATGGPPASEPTVTQPPVTTPEPDATPEPAASLTPGTIQFRVVNLREEGTPVDVYVRTMGLVQAAPVQMGLGYAEVTDYFAPPDPGTVVITTAGAGDPTCVAECPHIISSSSTNFGEGNVRTMVLYDEGAQELWHDPDPDSVGTSGNALPPADPSAALILTVPVALQDADFGLRLAFEGEEGCRVNAVSENVMVGGNQIGVFPFDGGSVDVVFFDNSDQECAGEVVGGPFAVSAEPGSRTLLVLFGSPGDMQALALEI